MAIDAHRTRYSCGTRVRATEILRKTMKSKALVVLSTLVMALALMAQSATQTAPAAPPSGDDAKAGSCCNHDKADGKMSCCGKDGGCCQDGKCAMMSKDGKDAMGHDHMMSGDGKAGMKCPMMSKDGKMSCCGNDGSCCKDGKCDMAKDGKGKSCCDGMKCERKQTT
jgi:hypothetical protein